MTTPCSSHMAFEKGTQIALSHLKSLKGLACAMSVLACSPNRILGDECLHQQLQNVEEILYLARSTEANLRLAYKNKLHDICLF